MINNGRNKIDNGNKMNYYTKTILWTSCLTFFLTNCENKPSSSDRTVINGQDTVRIRETKANENHYSEMRKQALTVTADQLRLKLNDSDTIVYGIVMDWDMDNEISTVVAFKTGDASLYLSSGQIFIGGYAHDNIKKAGLAFANEAQNFLSKTKSIETYPLPDKECVRFYFLTNKGRYFYQETVTKIQSFGSEWRKMFDLGNEVITQYRISTGDK